MSTYGNFNRNNSRVAFAKSYYHVIKKFPCPVILFDKKANVKVISQKAAEVLRGATIALGGAPTQAEPIILWLNRKIRTFVSTGNDSFSIEAIKIETSRGTLYYKVSFTRILDAGDNFLGTAVFFNDITLQKRACEELQKTNKLDSLGILAAGIAHDFNNHLAVVLGNISLAKAYRKKPEKIYQNLKRIEKVVLQAKDLAHHLSLFAQGEEPGEEVIYPAKYIKDVIDFSLCGSDVRCLYRISSGLYPVKANKGQLSQVLNNIIINAVQAMPDGGTIEIAARNVMVRDRHPKGNNSLPNGRYLKISVKDEGRGIPKEHLQKIFNPLFTTKTEGNGLGLVIASSVVSKYGGIIKVSSVVGKGTTFHIYFPARQERVTLPYCTV